MRFTGSTTTGIPTMSRKLKMYVWEGVLCDYTCGMAVALAHSAEEAKELLIASDSGCYLNQWDGLKLDGVEPIEVTTPTAFSVYGGG